MDLKKILCLFGTLPTCPLEISRSILFGSGGRFVTGNRSVTGDIYDTVLLLMKMI